MKPRPEVVTLLILLGLGALGGAYVAVQAVRAAPADFAVPTTDNETFVLSQHRGKVVVVDLFATWCASCKIVEASLQEVRPEWDNDSVAIVSIGIDPTESMDDLRAYQRSHNLTWTVARDTDEVQKKYNAFEIARVVILDPHGEVVFAQSGLTSADEFRSVVAQTLAGEREPIGIIHYGLVGLAMVAGAAAFFSPCAVGMLPAYVAHAVRARPGRPAGRTLTVGLVAAAGVLLVFFGVGGIALMAGPVLTRYVPFLQPLVGFLLVTFGVLLMARPFSLTIQRWTAPLQRWASDVREEGGDRPQSYLAYGIAYGAAAASCTAPVLLSVLVTAAAYGPLIGSGIVVAYAATGAFLMVLVTAAAGAAGGTLGPVLGRYSKAIEVASAILLVLGGLFLIWYSARAGTFAAR